ncbi:hypothetical protein I5M27_14475 [Adhaeribacter sp. BT258]|uniref:Outer membrane protein transport protein (OMPP1/FadL/TodX) n=1 Tax=Adhaeribacter terrigena TaxID=2793070 RepID=A0ABS1C4F4_9BACT|nr:hypothetical protein [Adhaeribacter terrigena]MBK0404198.1 hypothetical protein [Adhaeribacter terrigena]
MKNLKILATGLALLAWSSCALAQNETDALRYSQLGFGGTARIQGIAGAQIALGADASTMAGNPAGLGLYRRSEFTFSPGFSFNNTESFLGNTSTPDSRNNFNISQVGAVFTDRKADDVVSDWRSGSFGIGFTRLNSFQANTSYTGQVEDKNSLLQSFDDNIRNFNITQAQLDAEYGSGGNNITTLEGLAYATYLIDVDSTGNVYVPARQGVLTQGENIYSRGAQNQWDFSYGASYQDKLFIGGSLGLATVSYEQTRTYTEIAGNDEPYFSSLTLTDYFKTSGAGINFKVGLIYKPVDALRLGATIQTPTFYGLEDRYSSAMQANYKPGVFTTNSIYAQALDGEFEYNLTTPFRANGGIAYFIGKYGFISADVEYLDYSDARFSISDDNPYGLDPGTGYFSQQNRRISDTYSGAMNYRIGAEARFDVFRVRAGFAHYGDAFDSNLDRARKYFTGGIGLKEKNYFLDAAYVFGKWNSYYSPYILNDNSQPVVTTENKNTSFVITGGFNF